MYCTKVFFGPQGYEPASFAEPGHSRTEITVDIMRRACEEKFLEDIIDHSCREPAKGISDAALVISCSGAATEMLKCIRGSKAAQDQSLKSFILVHGKPDEQDAIPPIKDRHPHSPRPNPTSHLQPPTLSHGSERQQKKQQKAMLQNLYLIHPDHTDATSRPSEENPSRKPVDRTSCSRSC